MPGKGILFVHSIEDEEICAAAQEHLSVLDTITKVETVDLESLDRLGTVALRNKLKGRQAVVMVLSSTLVSSRFVRQPALRELPEDVELVLLAGRPCAWKVIPWLADCEVRPASGWLVDVNRDELDAGMTELVYGLAALTEGDAVPEEELAEAAPSEPAAEEIQTTPAAGPDPSIEVELAATGQDEVEVTPIVEPEVAAGGAPAEFSIDDESVSIEEVASSDDDALCLQFDETCATVAPDGEPLDDESLGALLELGMILGSSREDVGELEAASMIYQHAAGRVIGLINGSSGEQHEMTRFMRTVRLSMWRGLKAAENGSDIVEALRCAFEKSLLSVAQG